MWLDSKTVPAVTVKSLRQRPHFRVPKRVLSPLSW